MVKQIVICEINKFVCGYELRLYGEFFKLSQFHLSCFFTGRKKPEKTKKKQQKNNHLAKIFSRI